MALWNVVTSFPHMVISRAMKHHVLPPLSLDNYQGPSLAMWEGDAAGCSHNSTVTTAVITFCHNFVLLFRVILANYLARGFNFL